MAHLIKLEDYISRYQFDLNRYPSQYTRMKKERWYYLKSEWEQMQYESFQDDYQEEEGETSRFFDRLRKWGKKNKKDLSTHVDIQSNQPTFSLEQVRANFIEELFHSQLRWASSSLLGESTLQPQYKRDSWLKFFTQQIPDNYFLMYKPVFSVKKAPVELDIILISPTEIYCITLLDGSEHSVFEASSERFWIEFVNQTRKKRISPLVSLQRMTGIIKPILQENDLSFPIKNVVISPNSIIDHKIQGTKVDLIDKRTFQAWKEKLQKHPSPIKNQQMKVTSALLDYCYTAQQESEEENEAIEDKHEQE
ncbi:NERD domain-containing protein [Halalkalibacter akibai]|uniref:NERD domain-containing protein n=1 Tax=Halalkalibacter akibai (strain ATCC 43226 / DSM 21942 / CIP 109018 / JCM 9157 / 1139) TaxID=1236973 RepID=W4QS79_HALA3|nr:NERD domain-containing protein [Halalkalibacter akibai]GAE34199.1 hypothetical protein JCM9157_1242 [Halalkalibacter akibai JCM 9157]